MITETFILKVTFITAFCLQNMKIWVNQVTIRGKKKLWQLLAMKLILKN